MRRIGFRFLAAASLLVAVTSAEAALRPRYGGRLHVELRERVVSLDPRQWPTGAGEAAATQKLAALVFERLVRLDENLQPQPAVAVSWQHDAESTRWQFRLRPGVKFHDGSPLTAVAAAGALRASLPAHYRVSVAAEWLVIQSERPSPGLPMELARGHHFIFHTTADGGLVGTGPFRIVEWQPGRRVVLAAYEDYWAGRAFLDSLAVEMGVPASQRLVDLEVGKADLVELAPGQARRASQRPSKMWSSAPVELLALVFDLSRPGGRDARVRRALALSLDRAAISNVLLQRQAEVAGGLLPQWFSGYAFLFPAARELERARTLLGELATLPPLLRVSHDSSDAQAQAVVERVAVNAREAGIRMQIVAEGGATRGIVDARLVRLRLAPAEPGVALARLVAALGLELDSDTAEPATPEKLYAAERALLEGDRIVPLVHLPEIYGLGRQVKNWMPLPWGDWRLEDVWLEPLAGRAQREGQGNP